MRLSPAGVPRATARLQFHKGFTLDDAVGLVPYLARLGISHLYASPILRARTGSMHGYDVVDPTQINPEIGGEQALCRLVAALRANGLGLILDIVPNHMGTGPENPWWQHMLRWGEASPYARFFDVDWSPPDPFMTGKILLPVLGGQYGDILARGELKLVFDEAHDAFAVDYFGTLFPVRLADYPSILIAGGIDADSLPPELRSQALLSPEWAARARPSLGGFVRTSAGRQILESACDHYNGGDREELHQLLERQNYRLAWWRTANDEINWRRFFDVNELAGLRTEREEVFEAVHALLLRLYAQGLVDGFRIDHVDGLAYPGTYCRQLRRRLSELQPRRPGALAEAPAYLVVEKILAGDEILPGDWEIEGTSGYDFMDQVSALLHDAGGAAGLSQLWTDTTGRGADFSAYVHAARGQMIDESFTSELETLSLLLLRIARRALATRDSSLASLRRTLKELLAHFPVYRTYVGPDGRTGSDSEVLRRAIDGARPHLRPGEEPVLDLLDRWLGGEAPSACPDGEDRLLREQVITRFQQLTSPVAAKSVEDTAFYRYGRLISRNEVGSDPGTLALGAAEFHARCQDREAAFPHAMLATATHDHKRGEDARARLAVLSEMPQRWSSVVAAWRTLSAQKLGDADGGAAPDPIDELMLYQTLVGAWGLDLAPEDDAGLAHLAERVVQWQYKALREAKRHTRWTAPNDAYESACRSFVETLLRGPESLPIRKSIAAFVAEIAPAGALNGLSQTMLRLTTPGVPDLYQGTEFWDFSLVDPDNRSPVDWEARMNTLSGAHDLPTLMRNWRTGAVKQAVIARTLGFRREHPELFSAGSYVPLQVTGPLGGHALAFARQWEGASALVIVSRAAGRLAGADPLIPPRIWAGTQLVLPGGLGGTLRDIVSGTAHVSASGRVNLGEALAIAPVCLLVAG